MNPSQCPEKLHIGLVVLNFILCFGIPAMFLGKLLKRWEEVLPTYYEEVNIWLKRLVSGLLIVGFIAIFNVIFIERGLIKTFGTTTTGVVVDQRQTHGKGASNELDIGYKVEYKGVQCIYVDTSSVYEDFYIQHPIGSHVPIRYLTLRPTMIMVGDRIIANEKELSLVLLLVILPIISYFKYR